MIQKKILILIQWSLYCYNFATFSYSILTFNRHGGLNTNVSHHTSVSIFGLQLGLYGGKASNSFSLFPADAALSQLPVPATCYQASPATMNSSSRTRSQNKYFYKIPQPWCPSCNREDTNMPDSKLLQTAWSEVLTKSLRVQNVDLKRLSEQILIRRMNPEEHLMDHGKYTVSSTDTNIQGGFVTQSHFPFS